MILDEFGIEIDEGEIDFTLGYIIEGGKLKPDAIPPDNITKFSYSEEDFEMCRIFYYYTDGESDIEDVVMKGDSVNRRTLGD